MNGNTCSERFSHLLPGVQQHHVLFIQVTLSEVVHLGHLKTTRLIGAFEQAGTVKRLLLLKSENDTDLSVITSSCLSLAV